MGEEIFKAYDIRGIVDKELDEGIAYLIGRAFVTFTKTTQVVVGNDMRKSGIKLKEALIQGIIDQGANVVDIGLCSTSMFYYVTQKYPAGIMITASHNPKEYNGFKLCTAKATPISGSTGIQDIKELVINQQFPVVNSKGIIRQENHLEEYIAFCTRFLQTTKDFRIVVDAGNGMGGYTYQALSKVLPKNISLIPLYWELDGDFPNHEANPLDEHTLKDLQQAIKEHEADLGIATDGDGDRIFFVDEKSNVVPAALSAALIAKELLQEHKGAKILYDLRSSKVLKETIEENSGVAVESRVGHAFIKQTMKEQDILFGSEVSGHLYHKEISYTENEIIPLLRIINLLAQEEKSLSELIKPLKKYHHIPETNFRVNNTQEAISRVRSALEKEAKRITTIDGLKMEFSEWWLSLRASNTEPLLRLNLEANTKEELAKALQQVTSLIEQE